MKLLTQAIRKRLPPLGSQSDKSIDDLVAQAKFFFPDFHWTWYAIEYDGSDTFWGYVDGEVPEFGVFSLAELTGARGKLGMPIERDKWFRPTPLREIINAAEGRTRPVTST